MKPMITAAVFCNSASHGDLNKVDCKGIFTSFYAWGFPSSVRNWFAVVTAYDLPRGKSIVSASIIDIDDEQNLISNAEIDQSTSEQLGAVFIIPFSFQFKSQGKYMVSFAIEGLKISHTVPLNVIKREWPKFSDDDLEFLRNRPEVVNSIRANVMCSNCSRPVIFEEAVLPEHSFADNVLPFPKSGCYKCPSCDHQINLIDIQGQIRKTIRQAIDSVKIRKGD